MVARHGEIIDGELWLRCPDCGDSSTHPNKAHFSINTRTGKYHCFRCGTGGTVPPRYFFRILGLVDVEDVVGPIFEEEEVIDPLPGAGSGRSSCLERYHLVTVQDEAPHKLVWDAFEMRNAKTGENSGWMLRRPKKSMATGHRGYGWVGEDTPRSTILDPLKVVEGPYDVVSDRHICVYGFISNASLRGLRGHYVKLIPDGDVWSNPDLRRRFAITLKQGFFQVSMPTIMKVSMIPDDRDPDEMPEDKMLHFDRRELPKLMRKLNRRL